MFGQTNGMRKREEFMAKISENDPTEETLNLFPNETFQTQIARLASGLSPEASPTTFAAAMNGFARILTAAELQDLTTLPATYLLCYLNDFSDAMEKLYEAKGVLKETNGQVYQAFKESVRILRKVKYN